MTRRFFLDSTLDSAWIFSMKISTKEFRVGAGKKLNLKKWPTDVKPFYQSDDHYKELLADHIEKLAKRQDLLYAHKRYALLLIFQAMDAAGKDGAIKHVMSGVNPQGCQVYAFKQPSATELAHDFLWRTTCCLPERGHIGIFNRSYYEEVLVLRVHPEILANESLPRECEGKNFWEKRFDSIRETEKHLHRNGTRVIKFFLHLSKNEQRKRFLRRLEDPARNWKFSKFDLVERGFWKEYQSAYEECLSATSTENSPWYVVPADDKLNARLIISQVVVSALDDLKMEFPQPDPQRLNELQALKKQLEQ
jgi:PPK2 family polyphosphate:nucleotide phosphotransferase